MKKEAGLQDLRRGERLAPSLQIPGPQASDYNQALLAPTEEILLPSREGEHLSGY